MDNSKIGRETMTDGKIKLKGFTLVELILVIGIIGILITIGSIGMAAYIRSANMKAYNSAAHQAFSAMQNIMINCEITQKDALIDYNQARPTPIANHERPTYVHLSFGIEKGEMADWAGSRYIDIVVTYDNNTSRKLTGTVSNNSSGKQKDFFTQLEKAITDNLSSAFSGRVDAWIDYENYSVDSVVYQPSARNYFGWATTFSWNTTERGKGKIFGGCYNMPSQRSDYKRDVKYGGYPMLEILNVQTR